MARDRNRPYDVIDGQLVYDQRFDAYFAPAERIITATDSIIIENGWEIDDDLKTDEVKFQVDGLVLYYGNPWSSQDTVFQQGGYYAFKFYFTESAITTITHVVWNKAGSGSWQPKLNFEPVVLNDKNIGQAASGGYPNLSGCKMGKGAKVRVILANMTIPKIIEVIEPSEDYEYPVCSCGHVLDPKTDLFGTGLKCTELDCSQRYEDRMNTLNWWFNDQMSKDPELTIKSIITNDVFGFLNLSLNIDRWDSKGKRKANASSEVPLEESLDEPVEYKSSVELLNELIDHLHDPIEFRDWIINNFHLPGLCQSILNINYFTAYRVIKEFIYK
jgi:hypothetical protein